ncbi:MAG TPA: beta-ketoacyl-ACP synthase II [Dehalococcoidales bacterium]|nr:beta-ketoacyl-ACP synthase II [Dehalococcoidales bacterium]
MTLNADKRVVVTGMGALSPLGLDMPRTWDGIINGKSGGGPITLFDCTRFDTKIAGEVKGYDPVNYLNRKEAKRMDRFTQFAVTAAQEALKNSGLQITEHNRDDIGVIVGSGIGGLISLSEQFTILHEKGPDRVSPFLVPMMIGDMAAAQISITLGMRGINYCTTSACSSGSDGIGTAYEIIKRGDCVAMLAGGSEAVITPVAVAGFNSARALSTRNDDPLHASRPFDATRDGFLLSEGACILVLEDLDHARRRGAAILGEIIGYGASSDAFHMTAPEDNGNGAIRAMKMALHKANLQPSDIDYVNAHGTSTHLNDKIETKAIKEVFGDHAKKMAVSSTKSMTGHMVGAAGAIEAAFCLLAIKNGVIPPTINYTTPDPECDLDITPNTARKAAIKTALSNAFGFGGHNSVLVLQKFEEA